MLPGVSLPGWTTVTSKPDGSQPVARVSMCGELGLDLTTFVDAGILGALVHADNRLRAVGGAVVVSCRSRQPRRLLQLTGLEHLLGPADHVQPGVSLR